MANKKTSERPKSIKYVQIEPLAILSNICWQKMNANQRGAVASIILYLFANDGCIDMDVDMLKAVTNCRRFDNVWQRLAKLFKVRNHKLSHPMVTEELKRVKKLSQVNTQRAFKAAAVRYGKDLDSYSEDASSMLVDPQGKVSNGKVREVKVSNGKVSEAMENQGTQCDVMQSEATASEANPHIVTSAANQAQGKPPSENSESVSMLRNLFHSSSDSVLNSDSRSDSTSDSDSSSILNSDSRSDSVSVPVPTSASIIKSDPRFASSSAKTFKGSDPNPPKKIGSLLGTPNTNCGSNAAANNNANENPAPASAFIKQLKITDQIRRRIGSNSPSDRTAQRNFAKWLVDKIEGGQLSTDVFEAVMDIAQQCKSANNPNAAFTSMVKKQFNYTPPTNSK